MVQRCCVPFCKKKSKRGSIAFHEFPADLKLCQEWIKAIHHEGFTLHIDSQRVCSDHFKQTDYIEGKKRRFLIKGSVPSIFPKCSGNLPPNQASTSVHQTIQEQKDSSSSLQCCPLPTINTGENQCANLHSASHQPLWASLLGDCGLPAKAWNSQASTKQTVPSLPAHPLGLSPLGERGLPAKAWDSQACSSQAATKQTLPSLAAEPLGDGATLVGGDQLPTESHREHLVRRE
uniref:Putative thap domain protein n=1 Tax=Ixodes ricinus TaxID=34613 RepID=A0A0K8RKM7_IXORI